MLNNKIKQDFPIFLNAPGLVYLDSAATSQKPKQVIDCVTEFYSKENANIARGLYKLSEDATMNYEQIRFKVQKFINAKSSNEIIFTQNTTSSINAIMRGWGEKFVEKNDKIVTTVAEHHSNFVPWQFLAKQKRADFVVVNITENGQIDLTDFEKKVAGSKIVAISSVSNVLGTINDITKLCKIAHDHGAICIVDGAQSVPSMSTDVKKIDCDFLAFSGHKMLAPFGIGVLYGKQEFLDNSNPFLYGSQMISKVSEQETSWSDLPYKFEPGTPDVSAVLGLGKAIDYLSAIGMKNIEKHEQELITYALERISEISGVSILGTTNPKQRAGLVSFSIDKIHPHDVAAMLAEDNICVRSGHHCAMPVHERLSLMASTRASFYIYNSKNDVDRLVESLLKVKKVFG